MNVIIFDTKHVKGLHPLTFTRPMGALRCGILTTAEKWEHYLKARVSYACTAPINEKYPANLQIVYLRIMYAIRSYYAFPASSEWVKAISS